MAATSGDYAFKAYAVQELASLTGLQTAGGPSGVWASPSSDPPPSDTSSDPPSGGSAAAPPLSDWPDPTTAALELFDGGAFDVKTVSTLLAALRTEHGS
jgi:hypothetical protein